MSKYLRNVAMLLTLIAVIVLPCSALAIPKLQIYIPGATYNEATNTWIITGTHDYELWVIGATVNIFDVRFAAAVPTDEDGTIDVTWVQGELLDSDANVVKQPPDSETLDEGVDYSDAPYISFYDDGTPTIDEQQVPRHGVFPTDFYEYFIGDFGMTQEVQNYIPGCEGDSAVGEVKKFDISVSGYSRVDMVAYGYYVNSKSKNVKYESSNYGACAPEPATMFMLGTGLIGLAAFGRKKLRGGRQSNRGKEG